MTKPLEIAGRELRSRLVLGTGGFVNHEILAQALAASGSDLCTVALRRLDPAARGGVLDVLNAAGVRVLPNTAGLLHGAGRDPDRSAGPRGVRDRLGQARGHRRRPDAAAGRGRAGRGGRGARRRRLRRAARTRPTTPLSPAGWRTSGARPSCRSGRRSAAAWASATRTTSRSSSSVAAVPVILDAGIGTASDAALALELGCDAVLCASAISRAHDPVAMARAISLAVAVRRASRRQAGRIPRRRYAEASTDPAGLPSF